MYGYVLPDKPNLTIKDYGLYRAHYCGLCKSLGRETGELSRFLTNYDCTFLSIVLHNLAEYKPEINPEGCILNELKKKPVVGDNDILRAVAGVSVLLAYYKAADDVADEGRGHILKAALSGKRKQMIKKYPEMDKLISAQYAALGKLEKEKESSIDKTADCFAKITEGIVVGLSGRDDREVKGFAYHLGRWIYLMDAVDDVEEDFKKGGYNPVLLNYPRFTDRAAYMREYGEDLRYLLFSTYNMLVSCYDRMEVKIGEGVLSNIVYKGLPVQMERILKGETKCRKTRI